MKTYTTLKLALAFFLFTSLASAQSNEPTPDQTVSKAVHRISNKRASARGTKVTSSGSPAWVISKKAALVGQETPARRSGNMGSKKNNNPAISKDVNKIRR